MKQCDFSLRQFSCEILFLGTVGIHLEFGLNTSNVLRYQYYIMIKVAEQVVIMAE
jgi:DeoR/GlpR family transcriptional regulator of sugar metabolism